MTDEIRTYFAKFGLDASGFLDGLSRSQGGLLAFARDATVTLNMTAQLFDRVISSVQNFGQMANDLRDLSYTTGVSTEKLQQFHYAAILSGTSVYIVDGALQKLSLSIDEATNKSTAAAEAFAKLGINTDGKSVDQVFEETAIALSGMKSETDRNAIAMGIYGRSWKELIPYMQTYIEKSDEIKKNAPVMSQKDLDNLAEAKVGWDKLINGVTIYSGKFLAFLADVNEHRISQQVAETEALHTALFGTDAKFGAGGRSGDASSASKVFEDTVKATEATVKLTDRFKGLSNQEIDLITVQDELNAVQKEYFTALEEGNQEQFDQAARKLQELQNRYSDLTMTMQETANAAKEVAKEIVSATDAMSGATDWNVVRDANGNIIRDDQGQAVVNYGAINPASGTDSEGAYGAAEFNAANPFGLSIWAPNSEYALGAAYGGYQSRAGSSFSSLEDEIRFRTGVDLGQSSQWDDYVRAIAAQMATWTSDASAANTSGLARSEISMANLNAAMANDLAWKPDTGNITIEINQENSGTASPDEIAAATAKAISRALASTLRV